MYDDRLKTYGIKLNKYEPFEEKGKNYYKKGFSASQITVIERTKGEPTLMTKEYIDKILKEFKLEKIEGKKKGKLIYGLPLSESEPQI